MSAARPCSPANPVDPVKLEKYIRQFNADHLVKLDKILVSEITEKGTRPPIDTAYTGLNYYLNYALSYLRIPTNQLYAVRAHEITSQTLNKIATLNDENKLEEVDEGMIKQPLHVLQSLIDLHIIYEEMKTNKLTGVTKKALEDTFKAYQLSLEADDFLVETESIGHVLKHLRYFNNRYGLII